MGFVGLSIGYTHTHSAKWDAPPSPDDDRKWVFCLQTVVRCYKSRLKFAQFKKFPGSLKCTIIILMFVSESV